MSSSTSKLTIEKLAGVVGKSVEHLLVQMEKAGLAKRSPTDTISDAEKIQLIQFLSRGDKVSLRRKTTSHIKIQNKNTGASTVSIEVRKKKTYLRKKPSTKKAEDSSTIESSQPQADVTQASMSAVASAATSKALGETPAETRKPKERPSFGRQRQASEAKAVSSPPEPSAKVVDTHAAKPFANKGAPGKNEQRRELKVSKDKRGKRRTKRKGVRLEKVIQPKKQEFEKPTEPVKRDVEVSTTISVGELAQNLAIKSGELIKQMIGMGMMATINQTLDQETAILIVEELGHTAKPVTEENIETSLLADKSLGDKVIGVSRPPVVVVMGHVDHGKTSLLDRIRKSQVADTESGGITQHIGAYHVATGKGEITFLDTPGHAAFTSMRARGANATDIVVLVVAADDGIMPQTEEAIQHARAAQVPMIVAINKIDKDGADLEKVKSGLAQQEVMSEEWGGDTIFAEVSAKTGDGIDHLLEAILLQAEMIEMKAPVEGMAQGVVIESALDKGRGPIATVLVQQGTLKKGDVLLAGQEFGRVRSMMDENGNTLSEATPSIPVVVIGLSGTPPAGEKVQVLSNERKAREIADFRCKKVRESKLASQSQPVTADNMFERLGGEKASVLNLLVKADVQGSAEALKDSLDRLSTDEVRGKIVLSGIGGINESDVDLAAASNAIVIGFNVRADAKARKAAQVADVQIRYYSVIYEALDDVRKIMSGMLKPEVREKILGTAEVKDVFRSSKLGVIAGCYVADGIVRQGRPIRVLRDNTVIFEGGLESLRRHKDDVNEVNSGTECGIGVKNYEDVKPGDSIEVYERVEVQREL